MKWTSQNLCYLSSTLLLLQGAGSPFKFIPDPQFVIAAGVPCGSVSKQLANRGRGGDCGRADAAQR